MILMGDFNARTVTENDFVPLEGNTFVPLCPKKYLDEPKRRFSFDNISGRIKADFFGKVSCHKRNGVSVVDYIIVEQELLPLVQTFVVRPVNYLSDHSQIAAWFDFKLDIDKHSHATYGTTGQNLKSTNKLPKQFICMANGFKTKISLCIKLRTCFKYDLTTTTTTTTTALLPNIS